MKAALGIAGWVLPFWEGTRWLLDSLLSFPQVSPAGEGGGHAAGEDTPSGRHAEKPATQSPADDRAGERSGAGAGGLGGDLKRKKKRERKKINLLSCLGAKNCRFVGLSRFANQRDTSSKAAQSPVLQQGLTRGDGPKGCGAGGGNKRSEKGVQCTSWAC